MSKGDYAVYERASRDEDRLFLETAKGSHQRDQGAKELEETERSEKASGGKKAAYEFKTMPLILLLMVYHRKEYREMKSHLNNNILFYRRSSDWRNHRANQLFRERLRG